MTILEHDKVDFIGVDRNSGAVVLTISDHLDWEDDPQHHEQMLREKIESYQRFIESGDLVTAYPDAAHRDAVINVVTRARIGAEGRALIETVKGELQQAGIGFQRVILAQEPDAFT